MGIWHSGDSTQRRFDTFVPYLLKVFYLGSISDEWHQSRCLSNYTTKGYLGKRWSLCSGEALGLPEGPDLVHVHDGHWVGRRLRRSPSEPFHRWQGLLPSALVPVSASWLLTEAYLSVNKKLQLLGGPYSEYYILNYHCPHVHKVCWPGEAIYRRR